MFFKPKKTTSLESFSDEELLSRYQHTQDWQYYQELFRRYVHLVYGICLKYSDTQEDAKDLTMHIFEVLIDRLLQADVKTFKKWLYSVVRNECVSKWRKVENSEKWRLFLEETENSKDFFVENVGYLRLLNEEQINDEILKAQIDQLKAEQKQCIQLFYYEKMTYAEIAATTGQNFKAVKTNLQNGKRNLKLRLQKLIKVK